MRRQNRTGSAGPSRQFTSIRPSRLPQRFLQIFSIEQKRVLQRMYQRSLEAGCEYVTKVRQILNLVIIQFVYWWIDRTT